MMSLALIQTMILAPEHGIDSEAVVDGRASDVCSGDIGRADTRVAPQFPRISHCSLSAFQVSHALPSSCRQPSAKPSPGNRQPTVWSWQAACNETRSCAVCPAK